MPRSSTAGVRVGDAGSVEGPIHTTNYAEIRRRALKVAQRLEKDGIKLGDPASPPWRGTRGGISKSGTASSASARVYHTPSIRGCFADQICWIVNHAEDRMMFVDLTFVPILEKHAPRAEKPSSGSSC